MDLKTRGRDRRTERRASVDMLMNRFLNGCPYLCRATDISRSGLRLVPILHEPMVPPRYMGLQFQLPGTNEVITASGELVSDSTGALGIRFTRLAPTSAAAIDNYVSVQG